MGYRPEPGCEVTKPAGARCCENRRTCSMVVAWLLPARSMRGKLSARRALGAVDECPASARISLVIDRAWLRRVAVGALAAVLELFGV
jgi:hypothetical protein